MSATNSVADSEPKRFRPSRPGERRGGRAKGTQNHWNGDIKKMVVEALKGAGGVEYLIGQAKKNPVAFMGLVGRVLPLQLAGTGENGKLHIEFSWADAPDATVIATNAAPLVIEANAEPVADYDGVTVTFEE